MRWIWIRTRIQGCVCCLLYWHLMVRMNPDLSVFRVQSVPTVKSVCWCSEWGFWLWLMRIQIVALAFAFSHRVRQAGAGVLWEKNIIRQVGAGGWSWSYVRNKYCRAASTNCLLVPVRLKAFYCWMLTVHGAGGDAVAVLAWSITVRWSDQSFNGWIHVVATLLLNF